MARPSIYDVAGGERAFLALAAANHARCLADPELSHAFGHTSRPGHVERLGAYWAEVFGGPPRYSQEAGGHSAMLSMHASQGIGDDWAERFVTCFTQAIDDAHLPDDPELRATMRRYMEWATDQVETYSPPGTAVRPGLPMPLWSWDGLVAEA